MKPTTARQSQILEFIKRFIAQNGYSPSLRAIGKEIDLSPSVILTHLENMEESGLIERMPNSNRSIRVVGQGVTLRPEVQWFAEQMEKQLQRHEDRGGWNKCTDSFLIREMFRKANNLLDEVNVKDVAMVIKEAANVANFTMMIADNARGDK